MHVSTDMSEDSGSEQADFFDADDFAFNVDDAEPSAGGSGAEGLAVQQPVAPGATGGTAADSRLAAAGTSAPSAVQEPRGEAVHAGNVGNNTAHDAAAGPDDHALHRWVWLS